MTAPSSNERELCTPQSLISLGFIENESGSFYKSWKFSPTGCKEMRNSMSIAIKAERTTINSSEGVYEAIHVYVKHCKYIDEVRGLYFNLTGNIL